MHHFITDPIVEGDQLTLSEPRCVHQIGRVLRMQESDQIVVQHITDQVSKRYAVEIENIAKHEVRTSIFSCKENVKSLLKTMYIAFPNKASKAELIVQKLSEIGVGKIIFWQGERSQLKEFNQKKIARMETIALEAVEQSHGWWLPEISVVKGRPRGDSLVVFEKSNVDEGLSGGVYVKGCCGVVGPEGGFTENELKYFQEQGAEFVGLGDTVLRMETAAIVGAWLLTAHST